MHGPICASCETVVDEVYCYHCEWCGEPVCDLDGECWDDDTYLIPGAGHHYLLCQGCAQGDD